MTELERQRIEALKAQWQQHREKAAKKVPAEIRRIVLQEGWIHSTPNLQESETMGYLFKVYNEYIDTSREIDDITCHLCRQKVLETWKAIEPYLINLENGNT